MLSQSILRRALIVLNVIASLCAIALTVRAIVMPEMAIFVYEDRYKDLVFQCDNTMRDHLIAKNRVLRKPTDQSVKALQAAEVALLSCHDYDKLRKRLQVFGVSEARLAELGLEAIEEKAKDVRLFVDTHEFRY